MMMGNRALFAALAALCLASCTVDLEPTGDEPVILEDDFTAASRAHGVPVALLKAIAFVETGWHPAEPDDHADGDHDELGRPVAHGVFGLRGDNLAHGAAAAGLVIDEVRASTPANIAAAAARLAELAGATGVAPTAPLADWAPVIERFAQVDEIDARDAYVADVLRTLATGATIVAEDGSVIAELEAQDGITPPPPSVAYAGSPDFTGAVWRPSPNFSARPSATPTMVVIHTCEGGYASCWGWLKNSASGVSAHYVVNESGSEVTQLVRESSKAWHVSANYDCSRAGNTQCGKNGQAVNNFSVGIEHAGFGAQSSWSNAMIETSARLVCDITRRHNIPRDRNHIVSHGQLQPWNRTDPGANWPWDHYIDRVRAHCGDTGTTATAGMIVIDSNNANNNGAVARVELSGTWTSSTSQAGYYGSGYWTAATSDTSAPATFWFYASSAGTRQVEAWWTTASNRTTEAPFVGFNASGVEVGRRVVDQTINGSRWVSLGAWAFQAGWNKVVLSRWAPGGKVVVADAVRIR